jgi:hypothetical protein
MTIWSLLVSLTATTLGVAAFSPHAAQAEDFPSFSFMKFRLESMRPELESYVSGISSAKRHKKNVTTIAQASGKIAPETPEISATEPSPPGPHLIECDCGWAGLLHYRVKPPVSSSS